MADSLALHPEVKLDFSLDDRIVSVVDEGLDLAIRGGAMPETGLIARKLATARLIVCASPEYLRRHGGPIW